MVNNTIPSTYSPLLHFTISATALCSLGQTLGERLVTYVALVVAIILSLTDIYTGESHSVTGFVSTVIATYLGAMVFLLASVLHNPNASQNKSAHSSKLFVMVSRVLGISFIIVLTLIQSNMLLKALLNLGVIPMSEDSGPAIMDELQHTFFAVSFLLSTMALMLHASGVPILSPIRRASFSLASKNRAAVMTSVLYWLGTMAVVANMIITAILVSAEIPIIIQVASVTFAARTTAIVFRDLTNPEDQ